MTIRLATGHALPAALAALAAATALAGNDPEARFRGTGQADPIRIENVAVKPSGAEGASAVTFDIAWDHSWRAAWEVAPEQHGGKGTLKLENWDSAWVFVKSRNPRADGYGHATLSTNGADHKVPAGAKLDVGLSDDGKRGLGVFIYRSAHGHGPNDWKGVTLRWLHSADGVSDPGAVELKVLAIEMVYVPACAFWAGDGSPEPAAQFCAGRTIAPLRIESEDALTLGGDGEGNLGNRDSIGRFWPDDFTSAITRTLPGPFPKGYAAFYCMKYEITQGQYVAFLNTLSLEKQGRLTRVKVDGPANAFIADGENADRNRIRLTVSGSRGPSHREVSRRGGVVRTVAQSAATPAVFQTDAPHVACGGRTGLDGPAYAAWAGLRPMTELEFEKACRGPLKPVAGEYAWGTAAIAGTNNREPPYDGYALQNPSQADERVTWEGANGPDPTRGNAAWNGTVKKGDHSYAVNAIGGPLRVGIFATADSGRVAAGASYWGIMELSGNMWEAAVDIGNHVARRFAGTHGNGTPEPGEGWRSLIVRGGGKGGRRDLHRLLRTSQRVGRADLDSVGFRCVRAAP